MLRNNICECTYFYEALDQLYRINLRSYHFHGVLLQTLPLKECNNWNQVPEHSKRFKKNITYRFRRSPIPKTNRITARIAQPAFIDLKAAETVPSRLQGYPYPIY